MHFLFKKEKGIGWKHKKSEVFTSLSGWGRVDSNHRTDSRTDLQSVAIATMRLPQNIKNACLFLTLQKYIFFPYPLQKPHFFSQICSIKFCKP